MWKKIKLILQSVREYKKYAIITPFFMMLEAAVECCLPFVMSILVDTIAKIQAEHPYRIHLIFRELLMPNPTFDGFVKNYLYRAHKFMAELVEAAIAEGEISTQMQPTHVAFSLESMILFFFLMRSHVKILGNFDEGKEIEYLYRNLDSFLDTLKK